ncbi:hypothetical protein PR048_015610 [Dryococelus australis]|uniref:Reverse transcriptase Ty1/copia-type domain-containing protein n=1 Tax=Dryococelus australis TaxID=614101 RepID=A0ABQ9HHE4_9NEOP|nr:hypothetical protein PR048_015610 [Dryococelus australis]
MDSEETLLGPVDNMEVRRNTTVLQDDVVDEPFHVFPSDYDTAKTSEILNSLSETATKIENCNHQGRKERIKRKPQYLQEYVMLSYKEAISARLVTRGCEQKAGLVYNETFSSVVSLKNLRFLIAYAKKENMSLKQFDKKTAVLYCNLEQDVFKLVPEGFEDEQGSVVKLKKSLYGLKQVLRAWNKRFVSFLKAHGLHQVITDKSVFVNDEGNLILTIWVDDGLVISNESDKIDEFMMKLLTEFEVKITGIPEIFVTLK